jgi:hypothetical protein
MKKICPVCGNLVRYKKRKAEFKPHQVETGTFRKFGPTYNRELEPSLRGPGGPDAIGIPAGQVPVYAWCDGTKAVARVTSASIGGADLAGVTIKGIAPRT